MGNYVNTLPKWLRVAVPSALIIVWIAVGAIGGPFFGKISEVTSIDLAAFLPKSAEATTVNEELKRFRSDATLPALVVFESKSADLTSSQVDAINASSKKIRSSVKQVNGDIAPAIISDDKKAAFYLISIDKNAEFGPVLADTKKQIDATKIPDVTYKITGPAGFSADLNKAFSGIDGLLLVTALSVVFIILLFVYRSALLPIIVLMTSMLALCASILLVWWLAKEGIVQLNGQVQGILFILVIGAATDYSLLYVSRYREELYHSTSKLIATQKAFKASVEPVAASGGTVIAGLLCLVVSELSSNSALGPVGSIGVAFAMLSALTFLPSVLYVFGRSAFWPFRPLATKDEQEKHNKKLQKGIWQRFGNAVDAHPRRIWATVSVVLLLASAFVPHLKADGVAQSDLILGYSEAREGQSVLNKHFPDGSGSPAYIIASEAKLNQVVSKIDTVTGVDGVSVVATGTDAGFAPVGKSENKIKQTIRDQVDDKLSAQKASLESQFEALALQIGPDAANAAKAQALANIPDLDQLVESAYPFKDAKVKVEMGEVLLQAILKDSPDSDAAKDTIIELRKTVKVADPTAKVGGVTAIQYDTNAASIRDRTIIIPIVLLVITGILMLLLRSVIAPLLLLATTVLSFAASLGIAALLFNDILGLPGADPSVILYAFIFLVALGIDYNIFLMTRVREETFKLGTKKGVVRGLVVTGGVITSAGLVLAATFAALGVLPILFLAQLAFIVAFGVLLDTFVVRSLLVPALIRDVGGFVWWPSKLRNKQ